MRVLIDTLCVFWLNVCCCLCCVSILWVKLFSLLIFTVCSYVVLIHYCLSSYEEDWALTKLFNPSNSLSACSKSGIWNTGVVVSFCLYYHCFSFCFWWKNKQAIRFYFYQAHTECAGIKHVWEPKSPLTVLPFVGAQLSPYLEQRCHQIY